MNRVFSVTNVDDEQAPLVPLGGAVPEAPDWFKAALADLPDRQVLQINGSGVEVLAWGETGLPGVLLMHGSAAHADIWCPIAPYLAGRHRVVAFSWPGMGKSDWRDRYSYDDYAADLLSVAEQMGLFDVPKKPVMIGHSSGGGSAIVAAHKYGERFRGAIIIDSGLKNTAASTIGLHEARPHRLYASLTEALGHFRFAPTQPVGNLFIADMIARASLRETKQGWTWLFDPALWRRLPLAPVWPYLASPKCPLAFVIGEQSKVTKDLTREQRAQLPAGTPYVVIPEGHHHLMADQPLALISVLRTFLEFWQ